MVDLRRPRWLLPTIVVAYLVVVGIVGWAVLHNRTTESSSAASGRASERRSQDRDAGGTDESADDGSSDGQASFPVRVDRGDCAASDVLGIPGTDIEIEPLTREQEADLGREVDAEVLAWYAVADDPDTASMLDGLLDAVRPSDSDIEYHVQLLASDEVNAFAVPGGSIYFTTAIVDLMTEDELAFVMGHEIAHVECRHSAHQIEREALVVAAAEALIGSEIDVEELYASTVGQTVAYFGSLSFSREDESEADLVALDLMEPAGIPLSAAADALTTLMSIEPPLDTGPLGDLLSTHPATADRIDAVEAAA